MNLQLGCCLRLGSVGLVVSEICGKDGELHTLSQEHIQYLKEGADIWHGDEEDEAKLAQDDVTCFEDDLSAGDNDSKYVNAPSENPLRSFFVSLCVRSAVNEQNGCVICATTRPIRPRTPSLHPAIAEATLDLYICSASRSGTAPRRPTKHTLCGYLLQEPRRARCAERRIRQRCALRMEGRLICWRVRQQARTSA